MNFDELATHTNLIAFSGCTLNIDERVQLQLAVNHLRQYEKFDQVFFWGRIMGLSNDYYIVQCVTQPFGTKFPVSKFFWSYSSFQLTELQEVICTDKLEFLESQNGYFSGQHDKVLKSTSDFAPAEPQNLDAAKIINQNTNDAGMDMLSIIQKGNLPQPISELDRLSYTVRTINNECAVCPYSAFISTPSGEVKPNNNFRGLGLEEASKFENYRHYRLSNNYERDSIIAKNDEKYTMNFLAGLDEDIPTGVWSLTSGDGGVESYLRSAKWPGFLAYHRCNSNLYGHVYFGYGNAVTDFAFLSASSNCFGKEPVRKVVVEQD